MRDKLGRFKKGGKGYWKGKKRPNQSGNKNHLWTGGKIERTCLVCGKKYFIKRSEIETSRYCSRSCHAKHKFTGANHPSWKGGISKERDRLKSSKNYIEWRAKVFKRDKWTCKVCGHRSCKSKAHGDKRSDIEAHHIFSIRENPQLSLKVGNGITLCRECHLKTYGKEEKFVKVFKGILNDYMPNIPKG